MSKPKHSARKLIGPDNTVEGNFDLAKFGDLMDTKQRARIFRLVALCQRVARYNRRGRKPRVKQRARMLHEWLAKELPAILWDDLLDLREDAFRDFIIIIQRVRDGTDGPVHRLDFMIGEEAFAILHGRDEHWNGDAFTGFSRNPVTLPITFFKFLDRLSGRAGSKGLEESTVRKRCRAFGLRFKKEKPGPVPKASR